MSEIMGIVTGIDGTLVRPDRMVPSPLVVQAAHQLDIPLIPSTERSVQRITRLSGLLNLKSLAVADAGATIWDCGRNETRHTRWLRPQDVWGVSEAIGSYCTAITYRSLHGILPTEPKGDQLRQIAGIVCDFSSSNTLNVVEALTGMPDVQFTRKIGEDISSVHVMQAGVTVQEGVEASLAYEGFNGRTKLVAIGGIQEDMPLFEAIGTHGIKIALRSAPSELQAAADTIVAGVEEDGFVEALAYAHLVQSPQTS